MSTWVAFSLGCGLGAIVAFVVTAYAVMVILPDMRVRR